MNEEIRTCVITDYGVAAYAQLVKGCPVEIRKIARGRPEFTIILVEGETEESIKAEFLNSPFYRFDELVRRFKKMVY